MQKQNKIFLITILSLFIVLFFVVPLVSDARSGCCSWHGGVCGCGCCDGTALSATCAPYYPGCGGGGDYSSGSSYTPPSVITTPTCPSMAIYDSVSGSCKCMSGYVASGSQCISETQYCQNKYGYGATVDYLTDTCKCSTGYVFGKDALGNTSCVSGNSSCSSQYGAMSQYDSSSGKCTCLSGYVFSKDSSGNTTCISEDSWCQNKLGYNSSYNILTDKCECKSGYEITAKNGGYECDSCSTKYGFNSSYNYADKKCECDDGYSLQDNQCVKNITCSTNSTLIGDTCICNAGYVASGSLCITYNQSCQNSYGANSYGDKDNCYCSTGYQMNSAKTKCVKIEAKENKTPAVDSSTATNQVQQNTKSLSIKSTGDLTSNIAPSQTATQNQSKVVNPPHGFWANVRGFFSKIFK